MMRKVLAAIALALVSPALAAPVAVDGGVTEGIDLPSGVSAWLGVPFAVRLQQFQVV